MKSTLWYILIGVAANLLLGAIVLSIAYFVLRS
jgi:hypothetical protein